MKTKRISLLSILVSLAVLLGACSTSNGTTVKEESSTTTEVKVETSVNEVSTDTEVAIILKTFSNPYWQKMKEGIEEEATRRGIKVDILAANSEDDVEGQVSLLENAINKGTYKAIGVAPISPDNLNNAIATASKSGIYVVNIDEQVNLEGLNTLGGSVVAFVTTDNKAVGAKGATAIIEAIPDGGKVAIIEGRAGNVNGENRKIGAEETFKNADGFELVESQPADWDRTKALDVATNYLQKHPDLIAIYCCNDTMAMGAQQAVVNANLQGKVLVVGTDGNDDAIESVKAGELFATVAQDPKSIGTDSLTLLLSAIKDKPEISADAETDIQYVDSFLITK